MDRIMKKVSDSRTEQIQILMPAHINGYKRLFAVSLWNGLMWLQPL